MRYIYLITYNTDFNFNRAVFHEHIHLLHKEGTIIDWWHYIDNTYIVVTKLDINSIHNIIFPEVPHRNLFIIEIHPKNFQGWLPKNAWSWLNKYSRTTR